jgi:hypothetical protein
MHDENGGSTCDQRPRSLKLKHRHSKNTKREQRSGGGLKQKKRRSRKFLRFAVLRFTRLWRACWGSTFGFKLAHVVALARPGAQRQEHRIKVLCCGCCATAAL